MIRPAPAPRARALFRLSVALVASAFFTGCVSYSPARLSAMTSVDLCELQEVQGRNLSAETQRAMQDELQRRKESCAPHSAVLAARRDALLHERMYGLPDDP